MNVWYVTLALVAIALAAGYYIHAKSTEKDLKSLEWYEKNILIKQGSTTLNGNATYRLISVDGGKNWIATDPKDHSILGDAEKVYPGLLATLEGLDDLIKHVQKNGPITTLGEEEINLLTKSGFIVESST